MGVEPLEASARVEIGAGPTQGIVVHAPDRAERAVEYDREEDCHDGQRSDRLAGVTAGPRVGMCGWDSHGAEGDALRFELPTFSVPNDEERTGTRFLRIQV